jgi:hypothetical protein
VDPQRSSQNTHAPWQQPLPTLRPTVQAWRRDYEPRQQVPCEKVPCQLLRKDADRIGEVKGVDVLQAEKLRDLIVFLEKQGALGIKITSFTDFDEYLFIEIKFEVWKKLNKGEKAKPT